jgi:hypothetical protein
MDERLPKKKLRPITSPFIVAYHKENARRVSMKVALPSSVELRSSVSCDEDRPGGCTQARVMQYHCKFSDRLLNRMS